MAEPLNGEKADSERVEKIEWLHQSFVTEWPELEGLLANLHPSSPESAYIRSQIILEKYQEQASLLDGHIRLIMTTLTEKIIQHTHTNRLWWRGEQDEEWRQDIILFVQKCFSILYVVCKVRGYKAVLKYFPHEVARLEELENMLSLYSREEVIALSASESPDPGSLLDRPVEYNADAEQETFSTVTTTSKTGQVTTFAKESTFTTEAWHVLYVGALWLSVAILAPFHLRVIDSGADTEGQQDPETLGQRLRCWCQSGIEWRFREGSPALTACSVLLAKLLTRPDMNEQLGFFLQWALAILQRPTALAFIPDLNEREVQQYATSGQKSNVVVALAAVLKAGRREDLLRHRDDLVSLVELGGDLAAQGSALLRKNSIKLIGRIGTVFLPPRKIRHWHYRQTTRSLVDNLQASGASHIHGGRENNSSDADDDEEELDEETQELIEQITGILLNGVKDTDTKVRYSSARRMSYMAARLPQAFADQIIEFVLEMFSPLEEDGAWHGGCLALAEMGRRGVLIVDRLDDALEAVEKAFVYDIKRGSSSRGSHVRDAACYVAWAFARSYDPLTLEPFLKRFADALVVMCLFDREVNCRRAAAAAFQEIVGRQGGPSCENMPHGIEIITEADYFSLGNRKHSYLNICPVIAQFPEYQSILLDHLLNHKFSHWDIHVRVLASQCMGKLSVIAPDYAFQTALPKLLADCTHSKVEIRHGSVIGVAEITRALAAAKITIEEDLQVKILSVIQDIELGRLFRGRGGEMIRDAVCHLIESVAFARFKLPVIPYQSDSKRPPFQRKPKSMRTLIQEMINEHLRHPNEDIQFAAVRCIRMFSSRYHNARTEAAVKSLHTVVDFYTKNTLENQNPAARRGYSLALGALSASVLQPKIDDVINTLVEAIQIPQNAEMQDAETRRNALEALVEVCEKMSRCADGEVISPAMYQKIFQGMLHALEDYSVDNRGDVGSWVRESALICLTRLTLQLSAKTTEQEVYITEENITHLVAGILKQCVEKIDKIRLVAGSMLGFLLYADNAEIMQKAKAPDCLRVRQQIAKDTRNGDLHGKTNPSLPQTQVPFIPHREMLLKVVTPTGCVHPYTWTSVYHVYDLLVPLMQWTVFRKSLLAGICSSVGGLSKQAADYSSKALIDYGLSLDGTQLEEFTRTLITVGQENAGKEQMITSYLRTVHVLLSNRVVNTVNSVYEMFAVQMAKLSTQLIKGCKNVRKLMEITQVAVDLLAFGKASQETVLRCLLTLLAHKYPKVRQNTAEQLYIALVTYEGIFADEASRESVLRILSETAWELEEHAKTRSLALTLSQNLPLSVKIPVANSSSSEQDPPK